MKELPKPKEKPFEIPAFADLLKLTPADLYAQGAAIPKLDKTIAKAKETQVKSLHLHAKITAALKRVYIEGQNKKRISAGLPFSSKNPDKPGFFEQNCKGTLPGRVQAVAELFNTLVLTLDANGKPLLDEKFFDQAPGDWLEKANAILSAEMKEHGDDWMFKDNAIDTINALAGKPFILGDTKKTLAEIRKRQKPAKDGDGEDGEDGERAESTPLTLEIAAAFIKAAFAEAAAAKQDRQIELCATLFEINDAWANNDLSENRRNELDKQVQEAQDAGIAPGMKITRGEPVPA